jgi:hypothetical protein
LFGREQLRENSYLDVQREEKRSWEDDMEMNSKEINGYEIYCTGPGSRSMIGFL